MGMLPARDYPHFVAFDDDDDWVGEPPEGRHSRDRAKPDFWASQRPLSFTAAAVGVVLLILLVVWLAG